MDSAEEPSTTFFLFFFENLSVLRMNVKVYEIYVSVFILFFNMSTVANGHIMFVPCVV